MTDLQKRIMQVIDIKCGAFKYEIYEALGCGSDRTPARQGCLEAERHAIDVAAQKLYGNGWVRLKEDEYEHDWEWRRNKGEKGQYE